MLKNLINENELKTWFPALAKQLWNTQTTYQSQIDLAFSVVMNRMYNCGINPEKVYTRLDLLNTSTTKSQPPITSTITSATTGSSYESHYERRVVLEIGAMSGSFNFYVDGTTGTTSSLSTSNTWENATTFALSQSYANSTVTQTMDKNYSYLRYRMAPVTGAGTTITTSIYMVQTLFDEPIIHKALEIIFTDFVKEQGDIWDVRRAIEAQRYEETFTSAKFAYDADLSGDISDDEEVTKLINITLVR